MTTEPGVGRIAIAGIERGREQLAIRFRADDLTFATSLWWQDVDLPALERAHGADAMQAIYGHIAAFELTKLVSLRPAEVDLGPCDGIRTPAFERLWRTVVRKVWAQWRWEHDLPHWEGPAFVGAGAGAARARPIRAAAGNVPTLAFCGGGKDSLVALKLLERAGEPYASYGYAHSIYGAAAPQHALLDGLLAYATPARHHRHWVYDDFLDSPVLSERPELGVKSLTAAETPASLFGVLPLVLARGYRLLALAHERSANVGNLVWDATGEDVNHQWGKSLEAERLLDAYVGGELVDGLRYVSVLQPIHDAVIFELLARDLDAVGATHSCNVRKPWCRRCPKCCYVWLGYMATLPRDRVDALFGENLFDVPDNLRWFRGMLGLDSHTPFECIGEVGEARLYFAMCRKKGLTGLAMDAFVRDVPPPDLAALCDRYLVVDAENHGMPAPLADRLLPQMRAAAASARARMLFG